MHGGHSPDCAFHDVALSKKRRDHVLPDSHSQAVAFEWCAGQEDWSGVRGVETLWSGSLGQRWSSDHQHDQSERRIDNEACEQKGAEAKHAANDHAKAVAL